MNAFPRIIIWGSCGIQTKQSREHSNLIAKKPHDTCGMINPIAPRQQWLCINRSLNVYILLIIKWVGAVGGGCVGYRMDELVSFIGGFYLST